MSRFLTELMRKQSEKEKSQQQISLDPGFTPREGDLLVQLLQGYKVVHFNTKYPGLEWMREHSFFIEGIESKLKAILDAEDAGQL